MMLPAGAILLSAFLLFLVQPLMGRLITPWFGGSASVWTTCLVFFQGALVIGYGYAALSIRLLSPKWQRLLHLILLAASLLALPMLPDASWKPADPHHALIQIGLLLLASVGAPYMLLAATGPLVQSWHAGSGYVPWRLYAFSNLASITALLAYPFAIEPWFALHTQALAWSAFYLLAALLILALAWRTRRQPQPAPASTATPPKRADIATWAILAALPTALLVATTEYLTRDVAPLPLLWIPPLALYLLSFVVWFDGRMRFHRLFLDAGSDCLHRGDGAGHDHGPLQVRADGARAVCSWPVSSWSASIATASWRNGGPNRAGSDPTISRSHSAARWAG
jgi:hypothetical protein